MQPFTFNSPNTRTPDYFSVFTFDFSLNMDSFIIFVPMKFLERVFIILAIIGESMKLLNMPGHIFTSFIALAGLACTYLLFSFFIFNNIELRNMFKAESYNNIGVRITFLSIAAGITNSILLVGIIFFFQHIIYDGFVLLIGLLTTFTLLLTMFFTNRVKPIRIYKSILNRSLFLFIISLVLMLTLLIN